MEILAAQINPTVGDFAGNLAKIKAALLEADFVVTPELALCGYPPDDLLLHDTFIADMEEALEQLVSMTSGKVLLVGLVRKEGQKLFNSAAVIEDGKLLGYADKRLLPNYDVFYEKRYFTAGSKTQIWTLRGKRIAVTLCEDIWEEEPVISELANQRFDLLINLSASPYFLGRQEVRLELCERVSKQVNAPILYCNQVGGNDSLIFDGHSLFVGSSRKIAPGFKEAHFVCNLEEEVVEPMAFDLTADLHDALVLGMGDYFHKLGFERAALGLSGGIDSAVVLCLAKEAGLDLMALYMPSRYSSKGSGEDAKKLAQNLDVELRSVDIDPLFSTFLETLDPFFGDQPHDVTEENIQARLRGMLLMAFSNKEGHLILSPGNKSEMALGYTTLYGDLCGGLGVLADVTKEQVYELARYINREKEIIPRSILKKEPSAELRPNQKDSDSLPKYEVIDQVLERYVEEFESPEQIAEQTGIDLTLVKSLVQKIHANEYKRRQAPPGLRVTKKAFAAGRRFPIVQRWI
ncbi:MAG: Glutamine-dependent NAD(+) synthetase [Chlamydiales bacterium]|nr:Glutamine-dependent NAD(+) synthetase [Chlamydiales bacterium]MCH9635357.1 Glutamine-dependent NAD(+) synthetase [Chlamydiales bacterium]MCH9703929.1 NAD+ synthase [Chlamydiota bacterium]